MQQITEEYPGHDFRCFCSAKQAMLQITFRPIMIGKQAMIICEYKKATAFHGNSAIAVIILIHAAPQH